MKDLIVRFYAEIDAERWHDLVRFFASSARYERICSETMLVFECAAEIMSFYERKRDLRGRHDILCYREEDGFVTIRGKFKGDKAGKPIKLSFIDWFQFDDQRKIIYRKSIITND